MSRMIEEQRLLLQTTLDSQKTQIERNRLGQFATPTALACEILAYGVELLPSDEKIRFLDPAIGTGAFYSALLQSVAQERIIKADGFDIDPHYALPAKDLWKNTDLVVHITDFTKTTPPQDESDKPNLVICNPPYVRHHHLQSTEKLRLQEETRLVTGIKLSGLAGLYCHFLTLTHNWMARDGVAGWLIPSEFMDVNYGEAIKHYLLNKVTLLRIHRFDPSDAQFDDALVSSAIVWIRNSKPPLHHNVEFTFGGTLKNPQIAKSFPANLLKEEGKWTKFPEANHSKASHILSIGDLFTIKRGVATGDNKFFILTPKLIEQYDIPLQFLRPILPSPRYVSDNEIMSNSQGIPVNVPSLFLLDCRLSESQIQKDYPTLWQYLSSGIDSVSTRYLCQHRSPWYSQEDRPHAPIVCTYMSRNGARPFRFILNQSLAVAPNVYLMLYPKPLLASELKKCPELIRQIWKNLNQIDLLHLIEGGRVYGGGLHKLEPRELANIPADQFLELIPSLTGKTSKQLNLFEMA